MYHRFFSAVLLATLTIVTSEAQTAEEFQYETGNDDTRQDKSMKDDYFSNANSLKSFLSQEKSKAETMGQNEMHASKRSRPSGRDAFWKRDSPGEPGHAYAFWKRNLDANRNSDAFWKRGLIDASNAAFWKRSALGEWGPPKSFTSSSVWASPQTNFWKRVSDDSRENFWKRDLAANGLEKLALYPEPKKRTPAEGSSAFWKRAGVPWNMLMFSKYRQHYYDHVYPRQPGSNERRIKWLADSLGPIPSSNALEEGRLPPKNRREGPKPNPDFNPTGW